MWLSTTFQVFDGHTSKGQLILKTTDTVECRKANTDFPICPTVSQSSSLLCLNRWNRILFSFHLFRKMELLANGWCHLQNHAYRLSLANNVWYLWPVDRTHLILYKFLLFLYYFITTLLHIIFSTSLYGYFHIHFTCK